MLTLDRHVGIHPEVVSTELGDGETALLHLKTKTYFSLNGTGARIWWGLQRGLSLKEISQLLQSEFVVDSERADRSVVELVDDLLRQQIVQAL